MGLVGNRLNKRLLPAANPSFLAKVTHSYVHSFDQPSHFLIRTISSLHHHARDPDCQNKQGSDYLCELFEDFQLCWRHPA